MLRRDGASLRRPVEHAVPRSTATPQTLARRMALVVPAVVVIVMLAYVARVVAANIRHMHPARVGLQFTAGAGPLSGFEEVRFRSQDGIPLVGWWRPPQTGAAAIVLVHGHGANR